MLKYKLKSLARRVEIFKEFCVGLKSASVRGLVPALSQKTNNINTTCKVMDWARIFNCKLFFASSSSTQYDESIENPYTLSKLQCHQILGLYRKLYQLDFVLMFFYNVYGPRQICSGDMATVIGIFEDQYKRKKPLTVVKPGTQTRRFTHIDDTIKTCFEAWKNNRCLHYSISNKKIYSILEVAKFFKVKIKFLPKRAGERYASALTNLSYNNKVHKRYGKIQLKDYINSFIKRYKK